MQADTPRARLMPGDMLCHCILSGRVHSSWIGIDFFHSISSSYGSETVLGPLLVMSPGNGAFSCLNAMQPAHNDPPLIPVPDFI